MAQVMVAATLLAPALFLLWFAGVFAVAGWGVAFSQFAVLGFTAFSLLIGLALMVVGALSKTMFLRIAAGAFVLGVWGFAVIYGGSLYSNRLWGDNLSWQLVWAAVRKPGSTLALMGITDAQASVALMLAGIGGALVSLLVFGLALGVLRSAAQGLPDALDRRSSRARRPVFASMAGSAVTLAVSLSVCSYVLLRDPAALRGEPLSSFFSLSSTADLMDWDRDRLVAALEDRQSAADYPRIADFKGKNVILILADSFRPDRLPVYGYDQPTTPFLSELKASGKLAVFDVALSTCSESFCGIASILSSRPYHQISNENFKLNTILRRAGYEVDYFLAGDHREWRFLWEYYGSDIDGMHDVVARGGADPTDDESLIDAFSAIAPADGTPHFVYMFLMSPHFIGKKQPEFLRRTPWELDDLLVHRLITSPPVSIGADNVPIFADLTPAELEKLSNRYDNGIMQTDAMLRRIFDVLREKGYLKDSIVVITGDHGESLGERGHILHARYLYQKDMRVPLMIYDEAIERYRNTSFATHLDIAPTILDRLGLPIPNSWQGRPLTRDLHQASPSIRPDCGNGRAWPSSREPAAYSRSISVAFIRHTAKARNCSISIETRRSALI